VGEREGIGGRESHPQETPKQPEARQNPDSTPADANNASPSRFYQLKTGHCLTSDPPVPQAERVSLLDVIAKLFECVAAHLISDHLERKRGLHDGQFGCRKRQSYVDTVVLLMNRAQQSWREKRMAGPLLMDVKSAFNNVSKAHLGGRMEILGIGSDLIRWTLSFMSEWQV